MDRKVTVIALGVLAGSVLAALVSFGAGTVSVANAATPPQGVDYSVLPPEAKNLLVQGANLSGDDYWACEVALCMANPAGPMAVAECVKPIQKLYKELAKGNAFPRCPFVDYNDGGGAGPGGPGDTGKPGETEVQQLK